MVLSLLSLFFTTYEVLKGPCSGVLLHCYNTFFDLKDLYFSSTTDDLHPKGKKTLHLLR